jgi:hypothetical protein
VIFSIREGDAVGAILQNHTKHWGSWLAYFGTYKPWGVHRQGGGTWDDFPEHSKNILNFKKGEAAPIDVFQAQIEPELEGAGFRLRDAKAHDQGEILATLQNDIAGVIERLTDSDDGVFLIIDEADKPPESAGLGKICKLLTEELSRRSLDRLCIGLAGLPGLVNRLRGSHESSPRLFQTLSLQPLEPTECHQVIARALADATKKNAFEIRITPEAAAYLCDLSEGYPHFLQEFAYCAFEADTDNVIDLGDVTTSLFSENGAFDQLGRKYFDQFYAAPDSDDYRKVLDTMANHSDDWISRAALIKETGLKGGTIDNAVRALRGKSIAQSDLKSGLYRLPTKSFAIWIKARKSHARPLENPSLFPTG